MIEIVLEYMKAIGVQSIVLCDRPIIYASP